MASLTKALATSAPSCFVAAPLKDGKLGSSRVSFSRNASSRGRVVMSATTVDIDQLVSDIKSLTLEQARTLTDRLQEELGVSAAAIMPVAAVAGGAPAEAAPVVEEKTEFDLVLDEVPSSARIAVIKVVRALTGLGLKEAKDMIEGLPKKVKEAVSKEDAEDALKQLEGAGAKGSIK